MTLPRFTSGSVGSLQYHHLNEAFDLIESSGPVSSPFGMGENAQLILAQLGPETNGAYQWTEVVLKDDGTYEPLVGGRSSALSSDSLAAPAFALDGAAFAMGSVVTISPRRTKEGKSWWAILSATAGASKAMQILGTQPTQWPGPMWGYRARETVVQLGSAPTEYRSEPFGPEYTILNLAEIRDDDEYIGMGTMIPGFATAVRRPIRPGHVVIAHKIPTVSLWCFFAPNGYQFGCQQQGGG